ncbi:hypothetical protein MLD38_015423 [Melastoma candidum]|uniref:Uncharacterized protein n=1 Tax=Melastoma candidum TaxID=119954 RepID=A0ACB9RJ59_9MYRT|nr:hypothetical protein MLD38_015423 [Melastoma candidum]
MLSYDPAVFCGQPLELPVHTCSEVWQGRELSSLLVQSVWRTGNVSLICECVVELVIGRLEAKRKSWNGKQLYLSLYSSMFGGTVTDPAALPLDGHMVHSGHGVVTSPIQIKPPQFATMKSVNYLPNALSKMEAEENTAYAAIWLDAGGLNMHVAFVTGENELSMLSFNKILSGCTAKRAFNLAEKLVLEGKLKGIRVGDVKVEEVIGDGKEGPVARALLEAVIEDMKSGPSAVRIPIPY